MRLIRHFISAVLLACLLATAMLAAWSDRQQGNPALDFFPNRIIGATPQTSAAVQDSRGRLFVGSDALLVYDGVTWTSHPLPDSYGLTALSFGPDEKLWVGAYNQVGYYAENPDGQFLFTSLMAKLPQEHQRIELAWGCGLIGQQVFFVCQSKVLRWDGTRFTVWDFPGEFRLYPVRSGGDLWFTHLETGLYRLTADGPKLEFGPQDLPPNPAFGLERDEGGLRLFTRDGVFYAGKSQQQLCSQEVVEFLRTRPLSSVQRLPDGNYAFGTLGGLGIMSAKGELLRTFSQETGLPSNSIMALFLDREQQLWITHATGGIARLDPTGALSLFQRWGQAERAGIFRLVQAQESILATSDAGLYRLEKNAAGRFDFRPLDSISTHLSDVVPCRDGLLLGRFGGLDLLIDQKIQTLWETPSEDCWRLLRSQKNPDVIFGLFNQKVVRMVHDGLKQWQKYDLGELPQGAGNAYLDPLDHLWLTSSKTGLWYFDTATRQSTQIRDGAKAGFATEISQVTGHGSHVYFFTTREGYVAEIESKKFRRIADYPEVTALQCAVSADGRRLYVVVERKLAGGTAYGLGRLLLDSSGMPDGWTELRVPKLSAAGVPSTLLLTNEDGNDALWVGGSEGVVRIKPDELPPVRAPARPWLVATGTAGLQSATDPLPTYSFSGHHLLINVGSTEIDARPQLLFQTRLGHGEGAWSQAAARSSFEFTNLTDGTYLFEIRAADENGLVGPPASHQFRILPPWYRRPWAYAGFALAAVAAVFGYVRFRERRIRARNQHLESLVERRTGELVKANAAKDEFLAGISHEIRNPMNGVIGIATVIDDSGFDATTRQHMAQLRYCATHLSSLLEDILDYSRLQAGAVELYPQPFDLVEMTEALSALTSADSTHFKIPVEIAVSPTVPRYLVGDAARLRQILLNYVVNALKYSGRGKVCLTVWGQQVLPDQVALTFAVSDDGPGISLDEQARLFTRFERGAAAQTQRVAGTGLGLAMCKTLGEKMGGRLWVESEPGQGSTFYLALSLPVAPGAPARLNRDKAKILPGALRALVVDDEEYNRITLSSFLGELGFQVTTAATGDEALAIARQQTLHAVFLDVNLPDLSGLEVARALRSMEKLEPALPIIATTAYTTSEKRQQCSDAGMSAFLTKPVSLDKIHSALTAATSVQRTSPSFHPPGQSENPDSLGNLRLLAQRKGITLQAEITRYLSELGSEERLLADAIRQRESVTASDVAHRLVGRLAFINASVEAQLAREIEAGSLNGFWDQADSSTALLTGLLQGLRNRIVSTDTASAPNPEAPPGSPVSNLRNNDSVDRAG